MNNIIHDVTVRALVNIITSAVVIYPKYGGEVVYKGLINDIKDEKILNRTIREINSAPDPDYEEDSFVTVVEIYTD